MRLKEHLYIAFGSVDKIKEFWREVINKIMIIFVCKTFH